MLLKNLKVAGLLSFGPEGVDLPLKDLNVFIGPNGSGKSNFIEILALLKAAPRSLPQPVKEMGGVREWLWKGEGGNGEATIEALIDSPKNLVAKGVMNIRHILKIRENGGRFEVVDERIENEKPRGAMPQPFFHYNFRRGHPMLKEIRPNQLDDEGQEGDGEQERPLRREQILPEESILSQVKDPERYPVLAHLQEKYNEIRLFRNWSFGPSAALRKEQSASGRNDFLTDGGENLALVLSKIRTSVKKELRTALAQLYQGIIDLDPVVNEGAVQIFLEEEGGRQIPATRLSDGTLRYLCLLAILLHPDPPPIIAIEEPELGLHPDVLPFISKLLVDASHRTQIFVTTHSPMIVDSLSDNPETVIICERADGNSTFERLNAAHLKQWLEKYTLSKLWSMGEIGGNRW